MTTREYLHTVYSQFKDTWREINFPNLFREMRRIQEENEDRYPHDLGHYAIFYTPVIECKIEYMLVGNNPSWFHSNARNSTTDAKLAKKKIIELEKAPPEDNLYLTGDFDFAAQMQIIFANHMPVLKNMVGLNRFWIQTGGDYGQFRKDVVCECAREEYRKIQRICEFYTREIVLKFNPKTVFLFGNPAQKTFNNVQSNIEFEPVVHPGRGQVYMAKETIDGILAKHY